MIRFCLIAAALVLALAGRAHAASCSFSISDMDFGNVDTLNGAAVDMTANLNITCANVVTGSVRICPNIGVGSGGSSGSTQYMRNAANNTLGFSIYQDTGHATLWGSVEQALLGTPPTIDLFTSINGSVTATRKLYGRVLANQQTAATGTYSSTFSGSVSKISYSEVSLFNCLTLTSPVPAPFTVRAGVLANCLITAQDISFGSRGILRSNVDAQGALSVTCTPGTSYSVALDGGKSLTGPTARRMSKGGTVGAAYVTYGLYLDNARSQPWGSSAGQTKSGSGTGLTQSIDVYGRVAAQTTPSPGSYSDIVVATVTY